MEAAEVADGPKRVVVDVGRAEIEFQVSQSDGPSFFCLGVRKSGSTLLHKIVAFLARRNQMNVIDIPDRFFHAGLRVVDWENADLSEVVRPGNVYIGYRSFPLAQSEMEIFKKSKKIFMFRDPRDALVSQYFSDAYSHSLPKSVNNVTKGREEFLKKRASALAADIDTYVLEQAGNIRKALMNFAPLFDDPNCLLMRYEEYIFQKKRMIYKILKQYDWNVHPGQVNNLLETIDQVPDSEDKKRFVRKVVPGDHRAKLKPETITALDRKLKDVMELYDYY